MDGRGSCRLIRVVGQSGLGYHKKPIENALSKRLLKSDKNKTLES